MMPTLALTIGEPAGIGPDLVCRLAMQPRQTRVVAIGDAGLLAELPPDVDPCGENGEFHTLAFDGPMFQRPLAIRVGETVVRDGFVFTDLLPDEAP